MRVVALAIISLEVFSIVRPDSQSQEAVYAISSAKSRISSIVSLRLRLSCCGAVVSFGVDESPSYQSCCGFRGFYSYPLVWVCACEVGVGEGTLVRERRCSSNSAQPIAGSSFRQRRNLPVLTVLRSAAAAVPVVRQRFTFDRSSCAFVAGATAIAVGAVEAATARVLAVSAVAVAAAVVVVRRCGILGALDGSSLVVAREVCTCGPRLLGSPVSRGVAVVGSALLSSFLLLAVVGLLVVALPRLWLGSPDKAKKNLWSKRLLVPTRKRNESPVLFHRRF